MSAMPQVIDFFTHLFTLDIGFFVWLILANIFFLFVFAAVCHYFYPKAKLKTYIMLFIFFCISMWALADFSSAVGWTMTGAVFLMLLYITRMALLTFIESPKLPTRVLIIVSILQFYAIYIFYNIFMR